MRHLEEIKAEVQAFISRSDSTEEQFNDMALTLFRFQFEHNEVYRKYCRKLRVSPHTVFHYHSIPPVPITAFKEVVLACFPIEQAEAVFMTSGTTQPEKRGRQYHLDLHIWKLSMEKQFKKYAMKNEEKRRLLLLFPTFQELPHSSLACYLDYAIQQFGATDSLYVMSEEGLQSERLHELLREAELCGQPISLLGATFSFVHFMDYCHERGLTYALPPGSIVMDTGGVKGRTREVDVHEFQKAMQDLYGLDAAHHLNMYGMTEISSQCYTASGGDILQRPHWMRTFAVHPTTREVCPSGERGILVHIDLANVHSVLAVMTEDLGESTVDGSGFRMLGRAEGAEAKGCSLAVDHFMSAAGGK